MVLESKSARLQGLNIARTSIDFENPTTLPAMKVVVMLLTRHLVASDVAGHIDWNQNTFFNQGVQIAIHGSDPQPVNVFLGVFEDFLRP